MKKKMSILSSIFGVSILGLCSAAAAITDFSGTWVLDHSKSQGPLAQSIWTITQNDKEISISVDDVIQFGPESSGSKRGTKTYKLDGSETTKEATLNSIGVPAPESSHQVRTTEKAKWLDGGKVLELVRLTERGDEKVTEIDRLELTDNGKTLKVKSTSESTSSTIPKRQGGDYIYTKK
ncbi:MAG: hypothetical protein LAP85_28360 [Acidobacteriia bacterium]|nr:hypothetical protein [Terriglobia bacterium]